MWGVWLAISVLWSLTTVFAGGALVGPPAVPPTEAPPGAARPTTPKDPETGEPGLPPPPAQGDEDAGETGVDSTGDQDPLEIKREEFDAHFAKAQRFQKDGRHLEAVREYTAALELMPGDPAALQGRAESRKARTKKGACPSRAINDLLMLGTWDPRGRWLQQRAVVVDWMEPCGREYASQRLALAQELANEDPGAPGRPDDIRAVVARLHYSQAAGAATDAEADALRAVALREVERYRKECREGGNDPTADALRLQAELYQESGRIERAIEAYRALVKLHGKTPEAKRAAREIENLEDERELQEIEKSQGGLPTAEAKAAYDAGVAALRRGDLVTAEAELSRAIEQSPWYSPAYYNRGLVHARNERFAQAVDDLKRAVRGDRSDYQARMTLGMIYKKEFAGTEDEKAIEQLEDALRMRPDLHRLHLLLGELYARRSNREKARFHYEWFLRLATGDTPDVDRARQALDELERRTREDEPAAVPPPPTQELRLLDPQLQGLINEAYLHGTEKQDWDRAEKILLAAREQFPDETVVLNELAKVTYAQERFGEARAYWEQSLAMREDQMEVHERLALLLKADLPKEALPHLQRAAELGSPHARYFLAVLLWDQTGPFEAFDASDQLDRYLAEAGPHSLYWDAAQELRESMDRRFLQVYLAAGLLLTLLVTVPSWLVYKALRGASLAQLLERAPKSFPEVARILSLIRHEILKHNTSFLVDVGRALEYDAPDADARLAMLSTRLFGDPRAGGRDRGGRRESAHGGIYGRFLGYIEELQQVARGHGVTLNLYRKDPIFRPMIKDFESLAEVADDLRDPGRLRPRRRMELARLLTRTGQVLGRQAFEHLSGLIRSLCVVQVDREMIVGVYAQVVSEEQFAGRELAALQVLGEGARVRVFRTDLEDILVNVIRNSLRSSLAYASPPIGLGVELSTETDEITGLSSLAIRIKDRSPEQLSNEMLRGRYVERGMGITVDLLSRYDGAIAVEPEPGWNKAVVIRFFTLEESPVSAAGAAEQARGAA